MELKFPVLVQVMVCQSNNPVSYLNQESMNTKKVLALIACVIEEQKYELIHCKIPHHFGLIFLGSTVTGRLFPPGTALCTWNTESITIYVSIIYLIIEVAGASEKCSKIYRASHNVALI